MNKQINSFLKTIEDDKHEKQVLREEVLKL